MIDSLMQIVATTPLPQQIDQLVGPDGISTATKLFLGLTVLSLLPSIVMMFTCFVRLVIIFHLLRQAMGTQTVPPNQVLTGLALILTVFVMMPVFEQVHTEAYLPYQAGEIDGDQALDAAITPVKNWMLDNTRESDLALFLRLSQSERPATRDDVPLAALVPAFLISELKTAFQIGFLLFLPFLVIDLVVSSVLLSMGMMMLPPVMISFPFKILLFVMIDGWNLLIHSIMQSFR